MARRQLGDDAARHVAEQARRAVVLFELAHQGLVPLAKVEMLVDRRVLDELGPVTPPPAGTPVGPARIGGVRVQMTGDRHAHVAAVAHSPAGTAGYVLEMRRDGPARPWVATELSRVDERQLVGPASPDEVIDRRTRRLPANLSGLRAATEHARDQAAEQLHRAERRLADLNAEPRNTSRQRQQLAAATARARHDVRQWRGQVGDIDTELQELHDVEALRKVRRGVLAGDPLMSPRLTQLEIMLGSVPDDQAGRDHWRGTARRLLDYAAVWEVDNLLQDVPGAGATDVHPGQADDRQVIRELIDEYRHDRGWASLQRISAEQLQPGDRVLMQNGPRRVLTYQGKDPHSDRHLLVNEDGDVHRYAETSSRSLWLVDQPDRTHEMQRAGTEQPSPGDAQLDVRQQEPELELDV